MSPPCCIIAGTLSMFSAWGCAPVSSLGSVRGNTVPRDSIDPYTPGGRDGIGYCDLCWSFHSISSQLPVDTKKYFSTVEWILTILPWQWWKNDQFKKRMCLLKIELDWKNSKKIRIIWIDSGMNTKQQELDWWIRGWIPNDGNYMDGFWDEFLTMRITWMDSGMNSKQWELYGWIRGWILNNEN